MRSQGQAGSSTDGPTPTSVLDNRTLGVTLSLEPNHGGPPPVISSGTSSSNSETSSTDSSWSDFNSQDSYHSDGRYRRNEWYPPSESSSTEVASTIITSCTEISGWSIAQDPTATSSGGQITLSSPSCPIQQPRPKRRPPRLCDQHDFVEVSLQEPVLVDAQLGSSNPPLLPNPQSQPPRPNPQSVPSFSAACVGLPVYEC